MNVVQLTRLWCPPALLALYRRVTPFQNRFVGDYPDWQQALAASRGYDDDVAITAIHQAALAVKQGHAGWERDGKLFAEPLPDWPVRACLARAASANHGQLRILDYGGALGSSYHQHAGFLEPAVDLDWVIVEQPCLSSLGQHEFSSAELHFFDDLGSAREAGNFQLALLGCVLPYLHDPYQNLKDIAATGVASILLHRTPLIDTNRDRLTIQRVPTALYPASYPAWFFSQHRLFEFMQGLGYRLKLRYDCDDRANIPSTYQGLLFETAD